MAKVLITGGAGFIGSYVVRELLEHKDEVVIFDSFTCYMNPLSTHYQKHLEKRFEGIKEKVVIIRGDTINEVEVRRVIVEYRPERIIHLAALPLADLSSTHSQEAIKTIIQGTVNILEVLRDVDFVRRFIYASSSMIYGDFQYVPADEKHPKNPKDIYGGTKLAGEIMVQSFGRRFGIEYCIVRPSAVYGPTDINRRVVQIFLENALFGQPIVLHGGGHSRLDFTYVKDIAHGFVLATFSKEAANEIFNMTCGEGRSLRELAEIVSHLIPDVKTVERPSDIFRPERGALDISKARGLLGYEPKYSLEQGMKEYFDYVKGVGL